MADTNDTPLPTAEERLDLVRRENQVLLLELSEARKHAANAQARYEELESNLDPRKLSMEEKSRRFREGQRESLGIPGGDPSLQRDTSNDNAPPKPKHITEEDLKKLSGEEIGMLDARRITRPWRPF